MDKERTVKRKPFTQIPDNVVRNNKISSGEFVLLLKFKYQYYLNKNNKELIFDLNKLKCSMNINDSRTLKKYLLNLHEHKLIDIYGELTGRKPITFNLNIDKIEEKPFTQLPTSIMDKIDKIDSTGIRLLYYYESYIVRSNVNKQFSYAALKTIERDTGINEKTIVKYNRILEKEKLLQVKKHKLSTEYNYTDNDDLIFDKYNNHYYVQIENM